MTAEEYANKTVHDLANAGPGQAIEILTAAFAAAMAETE